MRGDRVKLTKCDKVEWGEKWHYASDILFEWSHVILLPYHFLYCEKVTSYEKFSHYPFSCSVKMTILRFNAIDGSVKMLKNSWILKNFNQNEKL